MIKRLLVLGLCLAATAVQADYLDYGLYWFGKDQASEKYTGAANSYYDDSKPTMIYVHGWKSGSSENDYWRENFSFLHNEEYGDDVDEAAAWIDEGWNVGIFYWNQFADETNVYDAEAKIWSATANQGMRYRQSDGSYSTEQSPSIPASQLMAETIAAALANNSNGYLVLHGHSLGAQMALVSAYRLTKMAEEGSVSASMIPDQLVMSDPYWTNFWQGYLSWQWTGEVSRTYVSYMIDNYNLLVSMTRSSGICDLSLGDCNDDMTKMVAFQRLRPWYLDSTDVAAKHSMADDWWTMTKAFPAPEEVNSIGATTGYQALSASTEAYRISQMMGDDYEWDQVAGRYTITPDDDQFEVVELD